MKHIYNGKDTPPTNIYRAVDGNAKKIRRAWRSTSNGEYVKVWDISGNEYLKVDSYYIGQKFLERYFSQGVYTSVSWVHEVDGQEISTHLSESEFASWECETLEPYYYTDGDRQYVGYYQTPTDSGFGQHDMKITYVSPETGETLKVEYPIYYLKEKELYLNQSSMDWYPFRWVFAQPKSDILPSGYLHFECLDKNKNAIVYDLSLTLAFNTTRYEFPTIENGAKYQFGENQAVDLYYISVSYARKEYHKILNLNIRPYYDSRNPACNFTSTQTGTFNRHYVKNLKPTSFTIDLYAPPYAIKNIGKEISYTKGENIEEASHSGYGFPNAYSVNSTLLSFNPDEVLIPPTADVFALEGMFPAQNLEWSPIALEEGESGSSGHKGKMVTHAEMLTAGQYFAEAERLGCFESMDRNRIDIKSLVYQGASDSFFEATGLVNQHSTITSWGYVYWGDGTFDRLITGSRYMVNSDLFEDGSNGSMTYRGTTYFLSNTLTPKKLKNGYIMVDGVPTINYENDAPFTFTHIYPSVGETVFTIETTCSGTYGWTVTDSSVYTKDVFPGASDWDSSSAKIYDNIASWEYFDGMRKEYIHNDENTKTVDISYVEYYQCRVDSTIDTFCNAENFVISLGIGDTARYRTALEKDSTVAINGGHLDILNYNGINVSVLRSLRSITLPYMKFSDETTFGFDGILSNPHFLSEVNFENSVTELREIFRLSENQTFTAVYGNNRTTGYFTADGRFEQPYSSEQSYSSIALNCDIESDNISLNAQVEYVYTKSITVFTNDSNSFFALITNTSSAEIQVNGYQSIATTTSGTKTIPPGETLKVSVYPTLEAVDTEKSLATVNIYVLSSADGGCKIDLKTQN